MLKVNTIFYYFAADEQIKPEPKMRSIIEREYIICGSCRLRFDRSKEYKHCSNCFACTGCEIYYCPRCDNEIVIVPVKQMKNDKPEPEN